VEERTPAKCPNKGGGFTPAEGMEGRRPTKENTGQTAASQIQSWENASAELCRVRGAATRIPSSVSSFALRRHDSAVRAGCTSKRPSGSVRGALGNRRPYRDSAGRRCLRRERYLQRANGMLTCFSRHCYNRNGQWTNPLIYASHCTSSWREPPNHGRKDRSGVDQEQR